MQVNIGAAQIESSSSEKLLGVTIDAKLSFEKHIEQICVKAWEKLKGLARVAPSKNIQKKKVLIKAFFTIQFSYCPLIWMFHSRKPSSKIKKLHERCLRIVCSDNKSSFEEFLETDNSVLADHQNI